MQNKTNKHLLKAAHAGNLAAIMDHHNENPEIYWDDIRYEETGDTILHVASRLGRLDIVEYLLQNYSTNCIDCRNNGNKTSLHEAAQFSNHEIAKVLVEKGADINALKNADWTPLMLACTKDSVETVKVLLENGANVNCCNKDGWTALHVAARTGNLEMFNLLLEKNPDINKITKNGRSLLHISIFHENIEIFERLVNLGLDLNIKDRCGNTPLHETVLSGSLRNFRKLLLMPVDVKAKNRNGFTVLHLAVSNGNLNIVEEVIKQGLIPLDDKANWGVTPLHCSARVNSQGMYKLLVERGADEEISDEHGRKPRDYFN